MLSLVVKDENYPYLLPSLINYYGKDQDRKLLDWCAQFLADKTGNSNITFMQVTLTILTYLSYTHKAAEFDLIANRMGI